jgi:hypothetical protein
LVRRLGGVAMSIQWMMFGTVALYAIVLIAAFRRADL